MPVRRLKTKSRARPFDRVTAVHLALGDCLLPAPDGCVCGLLLPDGSQDMRRAARLWNEHREEILAECRDGERPWIERVLAGEGRRTKGTR